MIGQQSPNISWFRAFWIVKIWQSERKLRTIEKVTFYLILIAIFSQPICRRQKDQLGISNQEIWNGRWGNDMWGLKTSVLSSPLCNAKTASLWQYVQCSFTNKFSSQYIAFLVRGAFQWQKLAEITSGVQNERWGNNMWGYFPLGYLAGNHKFKII